MLLQIQVSTHHPQLKAPVTDASAGAMGSYVAFNLAGLYPVPSTRQLLLSSPFFPQISFANPAFGRTMTIRAVNFKGNPEDGEGGTVFVKVGFPLSPLPPLPSSPAYSCFKSDEDEDEVLTCVDEWIERDDRRHPMEVELFHRVGRVRARVDDRARAHGRYRCVVWGWRGRAPAVGVYWRV